MKTTYFGHSAVQIETAGETILIDPFITGNPWTDGIITADELNPDTILLTHAHGDHWGDTPEIAERTGAQVVAMFEIIQYLSSRHGHSNGVATNTGGRVHLGWGSVLFTHARHSSSFPDGTYGGVAAGLLIESEGSTIYHAGDTSLFPDMAWIGEHFEIDLAFLPIGDCFTMGPDDSIEAVDMIRPKTVVPIHYNTFPPIALDDGRLSAWSEAVETRGVSSRIMEAGSEIDSRHGRSL
jgi:L-ascorbate metabolism protein UlaG (beta-lactamase superfamily)